MLELIDTYWLYFLVGQYPNGPLGGLALTLLLATLGLLLGLPLGIVLGLARVSPIAWLRLPVTALVFVVRGIPLLPVIFSHTKEIAVLGVCFAGLFLYIGLLFITGAIKPHELKAVLRRRPA